MSKSKMHVEDLYSFNNASLYKMTDTASCGIFYIKNRGNLNRLIDVLINGSNSFSNLFSNYGDCISSLKVFPCQLGYGNQLINLEAGFNLTLNGTTISNVTGAGYEVDSESLTPIEDNAIYLYLGEWYCVPKFNNFADYNGYTKIKVWLPYYGEIELMANDIMGKYVQFRLKINIIEGTGTYIIGLSDNSITYVNSTDSRSSVRDLGYKYLDYVIDSTNCYIDENMVILTTVDTNLSLELPVGKGNYQEVTRNKLLGAIGLSAGIAMAATGNIGGVSITESSATSMISNTKRFTKRNAKTGRQNLMKTTTSNNSTTDNNISTSEYIPSPNQRIFRATATGMQTASYALTAKQINTTKGSCSSILSYMNLPTSIIVYRYTPKIQEIDDNYRHLYGVPLNKSVKLEELMGYTELSQFHLNGFTGATSQELNELEQILSTGIIL